MIFCYIFVLTGASFVRIVVMLTIEGICTITTVVTKMFVAKVTKPVVFFPIWSWLLLQFYNELLKKYLDEFWKKMKVPE